MRLVLLVFHLMVTLTMMGLILLQKGEDVSGGQGGGYNAGSSGRGAKNILTRATAILATIFFLNCIILAILIREESSLTSKKPVTETILPSTITPKG